MNSNRSTNVALVYNVSVLYDVADFQNESPIRSTKVEFKINVKSKHVSRHIV